MALFKIYRGLAQNLPAELHDGYAYFTTDDGKFYIDTASKRTLINPDAGSNIQSDTTANWNAKSSLVSEKDIIYIYTDHEQDSDNNNIPGIKIGDGTSFLVDLPFIDALLLEHINDTDIHVTATQKSFWNNKVRCYYSELNNETVVFTVD